jgi:hypothetical protein
MDTVAEAAQESLVQMVVTQNSTKRSQGRSPFLPRKDENQGILSY